MDFVGEDLDLSGNLTKSILPGQIGNVSKSIVIPRAEGPWESPVIQMLHTFDRGDCHVAWLLRHAPRNDTEIWRLVAPILMLL